MRKGWVYILECADGTYYTGCTSNLERRLDEHERGIYPNSYTACRRPVKLVWTEACDTMRDALAAEDQIKGWSHKKKEALINERFDVLHELAKSKQARDQSKNPAYSVFAERSRSEFRGS